MLRVLLVIIISVVVFFMELRYLVERKLKREFKVFCVFFILAMFLNVLKVLSINIPNPFDYLTIVYKPITNLILTIFK
jgi:hypothetical protein